MARIGRDSDLRSAGCCWVYPPIGSIAVANFSEAVALALFSGMGIFMSAIAERYREGQPRKLSEEALREADARFRTAQENSLYGFTILQSIRDDAGRIVDFAWTYMNEAAERSLGVARGALIGKRILVVHPGNKEEGLFDAYVRVVEKGEPWSREVPYSHDGLEVSLRLMATKLDDGLSITFIDQTDLMRAVKALRDSEERFRTVQENTPEHFTIVKPLCDDRGEIIDFIYVWQNAAAARVSGHRPEEHIGRRLSAVFPAYPQTRFFAMQKQAVETGQAMEFEERYLADGVDDWFSVRLTPVPDGLAIASQIITERKRAEEALRASEQSLAAELKAAEHLQQVSTQLIQADNEAVCEQIMDAAVGILHSDFASLQMLYPERGTQGELRLMGYRGFTTEAARFWEWVGLSSQSTCGVALRSGQRVLVADVTQCDFMAGSEDLAIYLQTGIRAVQTTPLFSRAGTLLGMISTHWRQPHDPTDGELRSLDILARLAADLIDRKRAEEALRESERAQRLLALIGEIGMRLPHSGDIIEAIGEHIAKDFCVSRCGLSRLDLDAGQVTVLKDYHSHLPTMAGVYPTVDYAGYMEDGLAGRAFAVEDTATDPRTAGFYATHFTPIQVRAYLVVPLLRENKWVGNFWVSHHEPRRWTTTEVNAMRLIADRVWLTLEAKRAEEALRASEERFRLLFEQTPDGIIVLDSAGRYTDVNHAGAEMFGYTREEFLRLRLGDLLVADELPRLSSEVAELGGGAITRKEWRCRRKDGSEFCGEVVGRQLPDGGSLGVVRDMSERTRAEEALHSSQERMTAIIESAMDAVITIGADQRILVFNAAAERVFGCPAAETIGHSLERFIPAASREAHRRHVEAFATSGTTSRSMQSPGILSGLRANGEEFPLEATISQVTVSGERLYTVILRDLTQRFQTEQALIRSEKLASVGRMAATIAHEINNPLAAVTNTLYLAKEAKDIESAHHYLEIADGELRRIAHITRQSLGFYRESNAPTRMSVNAVLESAVDLLKSRIKVKDAVIEKQWDGDVHVTAVAGELRQVFTNILSNSLDAIDEKGAIKLRVSTSAACKNGDRCVRVTVADNGKGISARSRQHLFEPFFTTKGTTGTGLGLWVSNQIVNRHGGTIRMRSSTHGARRGTVFSVVLPVEPAAAGR